MRVLLLVLLFLGLISCSQPVDTAGTATETTNGFVVLSDHTPAVNARVKIFENSSWLAQLKGEAQELPQEVKTDSNGYYEFKIQELDNDPIKQNYFLNIEYQDTKQHEALLTKLNNDTLQLASLVHLSGKAPSFDKVWVLGVENETQIASDGEFLINDLPQTEVHLLFSKDGQIFPGPSIDLNSTQVFDNNYEGNQLLIADFDSTQISSTLSWAGGHITPFSYGQGDVNTSPLDILKAYSTEDGQSIRREFHHHDGSNLSFAGFGMTTFNPDFSAGIDLSSYKSLLIRMRGRGLMQFLVETRAVDEIAEDLGEGQTPHYQQIVSMSEEWQMVELDLERFSNPSDSISMVAPWAEAISDVRRFEFMLNETYNPATQTTPNSEDDIWFEIDKIYLKGPTTNLWSN